MHLLPMKYFAAVAAHQGISRAAQALFLTQQTLSAHMAALEKELGCTLFLRRPAFRLTPEGEVFLDYCQRFLALDSAMHQTFGDLARRPAGPLRVGISQTRSAILMPGIALRCREACPGLEIRISESTNDQLLRMLERDELDAVIGNLPEEVPELDRKVLYREEMVLAVPRTGPFAGLDPDLGPDVLLDRARDLPFIMNTRNDIAGRYGSQILAQHSIVPKTAAVSDSAETCLEMCRRGLGLYICPDLYLRHFLDLRKALAVVPLGVTYPIDLAWRKGLYVTAALRAFADACGEETAALSAPAGTPAPGPAGQG